MPYNPETCEHSAHEDCMHCTRCGECKESLNEDDVCADCYGHGVMNFYRHDECGAEWQSEWDCACNDQCPKCGTKDIEPHHSEDMPGFEDINNR